MGRRTLVVIASVLVAAAGTALIWLYVQGADERARGKWQNLTTVLVATEAIPVGMGRDVIAQRTKPEQVPVDFLPQSPIADVKGVGTRTTTMPVLKGQFLVEGQFATGNAPTGVKDNRMGVVVAMDDPNRAASLLRPGSQVAVYAVTITKAGKRVENVLPKVEVLGVGSTTTYRNPDGGAATLGTDTGVSTAMVTLDVDGHQAATLIGHLGSLYFTLLGKDAVGSRSDTVTVPLGANPANG
jgi:pilus assembly protein CpaB